jgi:hypothetical protein
MHYSYKSRRVVSEHINSIESWLKRQKAEGKRITETVSKAKTPQATRAEVIDITRIAKKRTSSDRPWWLLIVEQSGGSLLVAKEGSGRNASYTAYRFPHLNAVPSPEMRQALTDILLKLGAVASVQRASVVLSVYMGTKGIVFTSLNTETPNHRPLT